MNRKYTKEIFLSTIQKLKGISSDFTFTTDIIVGFPGESQADFQDTLDVMNQVKFAKVHMFPYSERKRTRAALFPGKVPHSVIQERKRQVLELAERNAYELREGYVGKIMPVLIESQEKNRSNVFSSHTENFLPVLVEDSSLSSNQIIMVEILQNTTQALIGRKIS
jgi:threonylcarbamoyladenosine tRNA methylthiotransferase MtaB